MARYAGVCQGTHCARCADRRRRPGLPLSPDSRRNGVALRHARGIRRCHRGATQEDCSHSSRLRQASAVETAVRQETDRMEAVAHSELAKLSLDLKTLNAKPLWERTTRMGPGSPAVPAIWRYRDMRPQLLRAIELITAKEAERRVFMLENPGLPDSGYITNSLYCGLQVIKPGEIAPAHRHSPNALRFIIEGEGAYSTVEGERVTMRPGDFVLTPGWTWHDHGHLGTEPVIWLDALDNPFGQFFGAIFRENYPEEAQAPSLAAGDAKVRYGSNLMPVEYRTDRRTSPLLVYPYDRTREALERLAKAGPLHPAHGIKMRYANPLNGGYVYPTIAVFIQWL